MKRHFALAWLFLGLALLIPMTPFLKTSAGGAISVRATRTNTSSATILETAATFTVTTTADLGAGSLRDAIDQANLSPGADFINFNAGLGTINVGNMTGLPLPAITDAVTIEGGSPRVELNGASAGTDANGLSISGSGVTLRGLVINNFALSGIFIDAGNCTVQRNFIGTDATGTSAQPNGEGGVLINGPNNLIGGTTPTERNVISGNIGFGIEMSSSQASNNTIQGNFIGTDAGGNPVGNTGDGIRILGAGSNNTIGGAIGVAANTIAHNGGTGVTIPAGSGNAVLRNSIFENGGPGININDDPGITPNDACDVDAGANGLQNFPVLTSATTGVSSTAIAGTLDSTAATTFRIEFFSNPGCDDGSTNGEGQTFIGTTTVNTSPACAASINAVLPVSLPIGSVITATATDPLNNTSEFSECVTVTSAGPCAIICPADFITFTSPSATSCGAVVTFAPETSGACGNVTCAPPSGSVFAVGTTAVTCNAGGGPSCSFNVIVVDETPPSITCSTGVTAPLPAGQVSTVVTYPAPTATDFCSTTSVVCAPPSGATFPVGSTLVACTARDAFENVGRCFFFVTVVDAEVPVIRCPANTSTPLPAGQASAVVNYPPPTVTDNFPGLSVVCSPASGSSFPAGSTTVTCTASDAVGNKTSCSFSVSVGSPQARVSIPGNKTAVEFAADPTRKPPKPKNNPCSLFTIENIGFTPLGLTFDSLKRTGSDVTNGRISDPNDVNGVPEIAQTKFFTLYRVNADQSLTQLRTGEVLTLVQSGQGQLFCAKFAALIPGLTGKSTGLAASDVLPNLLTSTITFRQNSGANIEVPIVARVGTGVVLINPANPRKPPVVIFTRNGNDIIVSYAVFDSNLDVTRAKYEFLDNSGQVVAGPFEIDLSASISSANLVRGQSFSVEQRFTGANSNPDVTSVRVTVFDGGDECERSVDCFRIPEQHKCTIDEPRKGRYIVPAKRESQMKVTLRPARSAPGGESMKSRQIATTLCLMAALTSGLAPASATAGNHNADRTIRLYASARFGPIGAIKLNSLSDAAVAIDGRIAQGEAPIWGGELIRVRPDRTARVVLESIGQVTLAQGAIVRFATARASSDDSGYDVLVASIIAGSAEVKLSAGAGAYVEAGRSGLTSSRGARFRVSVEDGRALLTTAVGVVRVQDQPAPPQDVNIRLVDDLGRPVSSGSQFSVRARSTRQIQVQVTDKNDKPLPDLPVLFSLGNPCLGSLGLGAVAGLTLLQKTDNRGIAAVPLVAGAAKCAASIIAKVEGTNASVTIQTNVQSNVRFWNTQNTLLVAAAAAAAGVATGVVLSNSDSSEPITPVPPPGVKP